MQLLAHCVIDFVDTDSGYRLSTKEMSVLCSQARTITNGLYLEVLLKWWREFKQGHHFEKNLSNARENYQKYAFANKFKFDDSYVFHFVLNLSYSNIDDLFKPQILRNHDVHVECKTTRHHQSNDGPCNCNDRFIWPCNVSGTGDSALNPKCFHWNSHFVKFLNFVEILR